MSEVPQKKTPKEMEKAVRKTMPFVDHDSQPVRGSKRRFVEHADDTAVARDEHAYDTEVARSLSTQALFNALAERCIS